MNEIRKELERTKNDIQNLAEKHDVKNNYHIIIWLAMIMTVLCVFAYACNGFGSV